MTACRASSAPRRILLAAATLLVCAGPAVAQLGPPVRLVPRGEPATEPASPPPGLPRIAPLGEGPDPVPAAPAAPRETTRAAPNAIEISEPVALSPDSAGAIDTAEGALPPTLWAGSKRATIDRLIEDLRAPITSPAARSLAIRLLGSSGAPPAGEATGTRGFVSARAAKLLALGEVQRAATLARAVPPASVDEALAQVLLDATWATGDNAAACSLAAAQIEQFDDPSRAKSLIFCQTQANEMGRAQLGLRMLRETQPDEDPLFARLSSLLLGEAKGPIDSLKAATPLHVAMARATRQPLPGDTAQGAGPAVLAMIAGSPNVPVELRLNAAERAEQAGAITAASLVGHYDGASVRPEDVTRAFDLAARDRGHRSRLLPYRLARSQPAGPDRLATLARFWQLGRDRSGYAQVARLTAPLLIEITPDASPLGGDAIRALYASGLSAVARQWFDAASPDAAAGAWPLLRLAGDAATVPEAEAVARLADWQATMRRLNPGALPARGQMLAVLLTALGDRAAADLLAQFATAPGAVRTAGGANAAVMLGLGEAAGTRRVGESALYALHAVGADGPAALDLLALSRTIAALRDVGLEADARAFALEAAIMNGL